MNYLYDWTGISGIKNYSDLFTSKEEINIKYSYTKSIELITYNGYSITINPYANITYPIITRELKLKENTNLIIENDSPATFYEFNNIINIFKHFLNFVTLKPIFVLSLEAFSKPYTYVEKMGLKFTQLG